MKVNVHELELKTLAKEDLKTLMQWASEEGWNPGKHDLDVFWQTDPEGFCGFFMGHELIAGGAIVSYDGAFGFMGLFIVRRDCRGNGIGEKLWFLRRDRLKKRLQNHACIGMDGVLDMQPFYRKGGFQLAFRDERYEFTGQELPFSGKISPILGEDVEGIVAYDALYFGFQRARFLKNWLQMPESKALKYTEHDTIRGYAVIRKAQSGYKIGPLFAENADCAEELFKACLHAVPGELVFLDIPTTNPGAIDLVKNYEGRYVFECGRMYLGTMPQMEVNHIFGITTFELG